MTEDKARLAHMAGQIAGAFHSLPDEQAAAAIASHINQFWAPRMRRSLLACEQAMLDPRVRQALPLLRPAPQG